MEKTKREQEEKARCNLASQILQLPETDAQRIALGEFYASKTPKEIFDLFLSDKLYMERANEIKQLLTEEKVSQIVSGHLEELQENVKQLSAVDQMEIRGYVLLFANTQAILRAIDGKEQKMDFQGFFPETLDEIKKEFPSSKMLTKYQHDPEIVFIAISHVVPLSAIRSDLKDLFIHHTLTGFHRKDLLL